MYSLFSYVYSPVMFIWLAETRSFLSVENICGFWWIVKSLYFDNKINAEIFVQEMQNKV